MQFLVDEKELQNDVRIFGKEKKLVNEILATVATNPATVEALGPKTVLRTTIDGINFAKSAKPRAAMQRKKIQHEEPKEAEKPCKSDAPILKTLFTEALRV